MKVDLSQENLKEEFFLQKKKVYTFISIFPNGSVTAVTGDQVEYGDECTAFIPQDLGAQESSDHSRYADTNVHFFLFQIA